MKKLAVAALCVAISLSTFFIYKKATGYEVIEYNTWLAQQKKLNITLINKTAGVQQFKLNFANGVSLPATVNPGETITIPFMGDNNLVQVVSSPARSSGTTREMVFPIIQELDADLIGKSVTVTFGGGLTGTNVHGEAIGGGFDISETK